MATSTSLDLQACAQEPIHIPGAIQPHGVLICLRTSDGVILQISANSAKVLGREPEQCLGKSCTEFLGAEQGAMIRDALAQGEMELPVTLRFGETLFDALIQRSGEFAIVELETKAEDAEIWNQVHHQLTRTITDLQRSADLPSLCDAAVHAVAELTGFDRVMIYRFDRDWNGEVIAEVKPPEMDPYLGLHYPASDIPEQARRLYLHNWLRLIVDADYQPVPLNPVLNPDTGKPLDLSNSFLRSVSPIHLEYLRNMGVAASMSISLIREGQLWGLIACHHRTPRQLSFARRAACQLVGQIMSAEITAKENAVRQTAHLKARAVQLRFFEHLANEDNFLDALLNYTPELLEYMRASGAAISIGDGCHLLGSTPSREDVLKMIEKLRSERQQGVFQTDALSKWYPEADRFREKTSGLLSIALSELQTDYVLWFRPEVVSTVNWAGNPAKTAEEGSFRIHPRKSFEAWREVVTGRSAPWLDSEIAAALELRSAISATILKRYDRLRQLNAELERKNHDLDSFAYIASHDLKEPLRGIYNYSRWVLEDYGARLEPECRERIVTISELSGRLQEMLDALLHFSRVGRQRMRNQTADMEQVVADALELLQLRIQENDAIVEVVPPLPPVEGDPKLLTEVFVNLISNAIKYNTSPEKRVTISARTETEAGGRVQTVYSVCDNGIGIREKQQEEIFRIFRRLHPRDAFGGGTGAGLAVVKSIVERHGGTVSVKSEVEKGSTFSITLPQS